MAKDFKQEAVKALFGKAKQEAYKKYAEKPVKSLPKK
jgi:hypothetical protein